MINKLIQFCFIIIALLLFSSTSFAQTTAESDTTYKTATELQDPQVLFLWTAVERATLYELQVSLEIDFVTTVYNSGDIPDTTIVSNVLNYDTEYFARVRAKNATQTSLWSGVIKFRIKPMEPSPITIVFPAPGSTGVPVTATFQWLTVAGADSYNFELSTTNTFGELMFASTTPDTTVVVATELQNYTTYYWRVRGVNAGGVGEWVVSSFTTIEPAPDAPVIILPSSGETVEIGNLMLEWSEVEFASMYNIVLSTEEMIDSVDVIVEFSSETPHFNATNLLEAATLYYWRVRGYNENSGAGMWSEVSSFQTNTLVGLPSFTNLPVNIVLSQNYPNPFNPSTTIQFGLPTEAVVSLEIYNLNGQKVAVLVDGEVKREGWHSVRFNAGGLASGIYIYRLIVDGRVDVRKLTFLK